MSVLEKADVVEKINGLERQLDLKSEFESKVG